MTKNNFSIALKKYYNTLKYISSIKDKRLRKKLLIKYSKYEDFYDALREIAENTVKQVIPLTNKDKKRLRPHKKLVKSLAKNYKLKATKKKKVIQSGGFINILLPILASLLLK